MDELLNLLYFSLSSRSLMVFVNFLYRRLYKFWVATFITEATKIVIFSDIQKLYYSSNESYRKRGKLFFMISVAVLHFSAVLVLVLFCFVTYSSFYILMSGWGGMEQWGLRIIREGFKYFLIGNICAVIFEKVHFLSL